VPRNPIRSDITEIVRYRLPSYTFPSYSRTAGQHKHRRRAIQDRTFLVTGRFGFRKCHSPCLCLKPFTVWWLRPQRKLFQLVQVTT